MTSKQFGKITREKVIPEEVSKVWSWLSSFGSECMPYFPCYTSVELINKSAIKEGSVGLVRQVNLSDPDAVLKERLDYSDADRYSMIYSLIECSNETETCEISGTVFVLTLIGSLSEIDNTPQTMITWACHYNAANVKMADLANQLLVRGIDSCFARFEEHFNAVIGKVTVYVKNARKLMTADVFTSDPYCKVKLVDMSDEDAEKTQVKKWTTNPDWNEEFVLDIRPKSIRLVLNFFDYDSVGSDDDPMGKAETEFDQLENGVTKDMELELNTQGTVSISLKIEMKPGEKIPLSEEYRLSLKQKKGSEASDDSQILGELPQFVQAKLMADLGIMAPQNKCTFAALAHLYLQTYSDELSGTNSMSSSSRSCLMEKLKPLLKD